MRQRVLRHGERRCLRLEPGELSGARLQFGAFPLERLERLLMLLHAIAVQTGECGGGSIRATHRLEVIDVEQQTPVPCPPHLVQPDETLLDLRLLRLGRGAKRGLAGVRLRQLLLRGFDVLVDRRELLGLHLALDFELPQLIQKRFLPGRQRLRFALERRQPVSDSLRDRFPLRGRLRVPDTGGVKGSDRTSQQHERREVRSGAHQSDFPSMEPGTGTPKYFRTVGAMSMIDGSLVLIGLLAIRTPAVVAKS